MRIKGKPGLIVQHAYTHKTYKLMFHSEKDRDMVAHFLEDTSTYKVVRYTHFSSKKDTWAEKENKEL